MAVSAGSADESARRLSKLLTPGARLVLSRLKERTVLALSLAEMAVAIKPDLPGLVLPMTDPDIRAARFDLERVTKLLEADDRRRAAALALPTRKKPPIEQRFLPDGGVLPALAEHPDWVNGMMLARAVVTELDALRLIARVEVRGATISEKWTLTVLGKRVLKHLSIQEWRGEAGKKPAE